MFTRLLLFLLNMHDASIKSLLESWIRQSLIFSECYKCTNISILIFFSGLKIDYLIYLYIEKIENNKKLS